MKKYFILAAVAATFAACSFDKDMGESSSQVQEERIPLLLGYSVSNLNAPVATTRGNVIDLQDQALMNTTDNSIANTIGLFILKDDAVSRTDLSFEHWNISSSSVTKGSPAATYVGISTTENLQYPTKTQGISLYAYAPHISATSGTVSHLPATFTDISQHKILFYTQTDQTNETNFMASDVLWGCQGKIKDAANNIVSGERYAAAKTAANTAGADGLLTTPNAAYFGKYNATPADCEAIVVMPLEHKGSKIIVNVKANGIELEKLKNATVNFFVDHLQGELNVQTGDFTALTSETYPATVTTSNERKVTLTTNLGIKGDISGSWNTDAQGQIDSNSDSEIDTYQCAAVIVPQTNTETAKTGTDTNEGRAIEIILKASTAQNAASSTTYIYKDTTAREFKSGKKYIYTITVTATGLQVTTKVADWVEDTWGNSTTNAGGDADLQ